jgi:hypothetical protein
MLMHKKFAGYVGTRAFFSVQIAGNLTTSYVEHVMLPVLLVQGLRSL